MTDKSELRSSNPDLVMEVDSVGKKKEKQLFNLDRLQGIYSSYQKPPPVLNRLESSHFLEDTKIKDMHILSSSPDDKKRHFSASNVHDHLKKGDPVFPRLWKDHKFPKLPTRIYPETSNITEKNSSKDVQIDITAPPSIDESFFFNNFEFLRGVEIDGINILKAIWDTVSAEEIKILQEMETDNIPERDGILFPDFDEKFRSIAFTWACIRGLSQILAKLEASGADIDNVYFKGATPIMFAAFSGEIACLKYLIKRGVNLNYVSPRYGHCALHSAAAGNRLKAAELLLDNGGDLNNVSQNPYMIPLLHYAIRIKSEAIAELFIKRGANLRQKNLNGETPLHVACRVKSLKCCKLLLKRPEVDVNALDEMNRTPLHQALMATRSNIKIVELLLEHGALVNQVDKKGFSPLHIAALEEQAESVEILIRNGADLSATTGKGLSALGIILRKIPECLQAFRMKIDSSIMLRHPGCQCKEFEMRFDFTPLLPSDDRPESSLINTLIQENVTDLIKHPLVTAFLFLKWQRIKKFYLINIFVYTLMLIVMSTYVITALAYECYNSFQEDSTKINDTIVICYYFDKQVVAFNWYIWLLFVCLMIPRKILSFATIQSFKESFCNVDNTLDTVVIMSVFATSFFYTGKTYHWQKYVGAFSVLCAWTNLMLMLGQLPGLGIYVMMFGHIQYEFARLLFAYSGLIIGFILSFCMIFNGEPCFANILTGAMKILTMMSGELDFEGVVNQRDGSASGYIVVYDPLSVCSQILFALFVIFIVVILMNLLVGIAVHDIKGLRNRAGIVKIIRTIKLIVYTEMVESKMMLYSFLKVLLSNKAEAQLRNHILIVKPLNPQENRIPRLILNSAYEIAKQNSPILDDEYTDWSNKVSYVPKKKEENRENTLENTFENISLQFKINADEFLEIKDQLRETKTVLAEIMLKLS